MESTYRAVKLNLALPGLTNPGTDVYFGNEHRGYKICGLSYAVLSILS